jgi:hypothetical protein
VLAAVNHEHIRTFTYTSILVLWGLFRQIPFMALSKYIQSLMIMWLCAWYTISWTCAVQHSTHTTANGKSVTWLNADEISPSKFNKLLFKDPNLKSTQYYCETLLHTTNNRKCQNMFTRSVTILHNTLHPQVTHIVQEKTCSLHWNLNLSLCGFYAFGAFKKACKSHRCGSKMSKL